MKKTLLILIVLSIAGLSNAQGILLSPHSGVVFEDVVARSMLRDSLGWLDGWTTNAEAANLMFYDPITNTISYYDTTGWKGGSGGGDMLSVNNLSDVADAPTSVINLGITATASEINTPLDGAVVTLTEFKELETIGATTISANQWAATGSMPESLTGVE